MIRKIYYSWQIIQFIILIIPLIGLCAMFLEDFTEDNSFMRKHSWFWHILLTPWQVVCIVTIMMASII